jgi:uncharacterized protein YktA (UPF0223 family)
LFRVSFNEVGKHYKTYKYFIEDRENERHYNRSLSDHSHYSHSLSTKKKKNSFNDDGKLKYI